MVGRYATWTDRQDLLQGNLGRLCALALGDSKGSYFGRIKPMSRTV